MVIRDEWMIWGTPMTSEISKWHTSTVLESWGQDDMWVLFDDDDVSFVSWKDMTGESCRVRTAGVAGI